MTATQTPKAQGTLTQRLKNIDQAVYVGIIVVLLGVVLSLAVGPFARVANFHAILAASAGLGVLALAQAIVVIGRGLDLSVVAIYGVTGQLVAQMLTNGHGQVVTLLTGLGLAILLGAINGVLVAYVEMPPLFVTLASSLFFLGAARILLFDRVTIFNIPRDGGFITGLGSRSLGLVPISFIVWMIVAVLVAWWLRRTVAGRMVYAIGDNTETARITGMPARPMIFLTYVLSAVIAFIGGLILVTASGSFDTRTISAGTQLYDVLAIVVIGGISLSGGRGTVWGTVTATLLVGVILNGITLLNFDTTQQLFFKSIVVLIALVIDRRMHPQDEETVRPGEL